MNTQAIRTDIFSKDQNLIEFILKHTKDLKEKSILAITSKIISVSENRIIPKNKIDKKQLIKKECEHYLGEVAYGCHLTIHHNLLLPSAGIDESNSKNDEYILYPKNPFASAKNIYKAIKKKLSLKDFGVIVTDSRTLPLRQGVVGVALAYSGFKGVKNLIGKKDLFNRPLKMTKINILDALASSAVLLMGEGNEKCPLAIIDNAPVCFVEQEKPSEINIPLEKDLYYPLYKTLLKEDY